MKPTTVLVRLCIYTQNGDVFVDYGAFVYIVNCTHSSHHVSDKRRLNLRQTLSPLPPSASLFIPPQSSSSPLYVLRHHHHKLHHHHQQHLHLPHQQWPKCSIHCPKPHLVFHHEVTKATSPIFFFFFFFKSRPRVL